MVFFNIHLPLIEGWIRKIIFWANSKHFLPFFRFTSRVRILSMEYADTDELCSIYAACLTPVLHHHPALQRHPVWGSSARIQQLASSMVQIYEQVRKVFLSDDHGHYLFTPRDLTKWCMSMIRYDHSSVTGDGRSADSLLSVWTYEACRMFRFVFIQLCDFLRKACIRIICNCYTFLESTTCVFLACCLGIRLLTQDLI